ncbi:MAG: HEAT repeat domain-containing protein [Actinobacteria bacterium]|nr:HEAT repeat domain-containing protein [Actinomycetota bacterium]
MMVIISLLSTSSAGRNDALVVIATILIILALLINSLGFALWIRKSMKRLLNGTKPLKYKHKYPAIVALVDGGYVISMAQRKPALVPGAGLQPWATAASGREPRTHVIPKSYGLYDDSPLIVEESPDLERLLNSDEPPVIQTLSDRNRSFWEEVASTEAKRTSLLIGYLQHPDPDIRIRTMEYAAMSASSRVTQVLVDILGSDPSSTVKIAAAKTIWEREKESNCDFTIRCLKDEIDYGTERSTVGPTRAKGAMRLLIEHAPDQDRREAVKELIRSKGIHDI